MFDILTIMKPYLKEERNMIARHLRSIRVENKEKARFVLARFKRGIAATEAALEQNLR